MDQLLHKKYDLNIVVPKKFLRFKRKKTIKIHYWQAKPIDMAQFMRLGTPDEIIVWLVKFVESHSTNMKKSDYNAIIAQFEWIYAALQTTFWKRSVKNNGGEGNGSPYSRFVAFLAKELCETPHNIVYNYTLEELDYLTEWVVRNLNEQSEEWRQKNKLKAIETSSNAVFKEKKEMIEAFLKD